MNTLKVNQVMQGLKVASSPKRYSILKIIQKLAPIKYSKLKELILNENESSLIFTFHLRILRKYDMIKCMEQTNHYTLTKRGKFMIDTLEEYSEKYMIEDQTAICKNNKTNYHDFIKICRKCALIQKELII